MLLLLLLLLPLLTRMHRSTQQLTLLRFCRAQLFQESAEIPALSLTGGASGSAGPAAARARAPAPAPSPLMMDAEESGAGTDIEDAGVRASLLVALRACALC